MKKQPISLEEKKRIQLEMLKEIDSICRANNIKYSLAFGTLLGAVRHKGFIPWDDDVDIMMPLPEVEKFRKVLDSNNIKYIDINTEKYYPFPFPDVVDKNSYSKRGLILKSWGIDINLYPVRGLPSTVEDINKFYAKANSILKWRHFFTRVRSRLIRYLPIKTIPFYAYFNRKYYEFCSQYPYEGTKYYLVHAGYLNWKHTFDYDIFSQMIELPFEGYSFMAIAKYHDFLTKRYGDYMTPEVFPCHGGVFYHK